MNILHQVECRMFRHIHIHVECIAFKKKKNLVGFRLNGKTGHITMLYSTLNIIEYKVHVNVLNVFIHKHCLEIHFKRKTAEI